MRDSRRSRHDGGAFLNKINSIAKSNDKIKQMKAAGAKALEALTPSPEQD
jgi:hypothetical protein